MTLPVIPASADTYGRYDTYKYIHKALRMAQCDMLSRLGRADFNSEEGMALLAELRTLLAMGASHIGHEETHIHVHMEAREPTSTQRLDNQHAGHRDSFARIEGLIHQVELATPGQKADAGHRLYLAYALFVAHDFEHMHEEETSNNERLWRLFTDAEIVAMERAIVASIPPEKAIGVMRLMIPALTRDERAGFLAKMKPAVPPEAFMAVIEHAARPTLAANDFTDLRERLGLNLTAVA